MSCPSCQADPALLHWSESKTVGIGTGHLSFSSEGTGKITGVKVWEVPGAYITGIQLRYGSCWSQVLGHEYGSEYQQIDLFDDESIVQVSGKVINYIYLLVFVTSRGRSLIVGQPLQSSFNFYATHPSAELRKLSGRSNGHAITALRAHWGTVCEHHCSRHRTHYPK